VRVRTKSGIFRSPYVLGRAVSTIEEQEPNDEPAKAQKIPMTSPSGRHRPGGCGLVFRDGEGKASASRSKWREFVWAPVFDSKVTVLDPNGKILKAPMKQSWYCRTRSSRWSPQKAGTYTIQLRESYGGSSASAYRMHIEIFPGPMAVFPAGGQTGESVNRQFYWRLQGGITQKFKLPAEANDRFGILAENDGLLAPSAKTGFRVSPFANVIEAEPNDDMQHATATDMELPLALNGIISKKGDVDWYKFKAKKGQSFDVNVYARRIRSMLDSTVQILDAKGASLAQKDGFGRLDSYVKFQRGRGMATIISRSPISWARVGRSSPKPRRDRAGSPRRFRLHPGRLAQQNTQERKSSWCRREIGSRP